MTDVRTSKQSVSPPIVCIGASAGGLEAIEHFFNHCPTNLDAAFVVIQHLSSNYKSVMEDLISRYTEMPVHMIKSGTRPEANHIYLIEAGTTVTYQNSLFKVENKPTGELTLPIDIFLNSITAEQVPVAAAIILSGTGSDGSRGAVNINSIGGFVIAQEPSDAGFDGMPRSVINAGIVDDIRTASEIPSTLQRFLSAYPDVKHRDTAKAEKEQPVKTYLSRILVKLLHEYNIDFSKYKQATILRRIERRMQVKQVHSYSAYADLIESDPFEPSDLRRELLIPVTQFFRDNEIFQSLTQKVIPDIVTRASSRAEIRIWVAGCASGEEAYSLTILFHEEIARQNKLCGVKLFATDANPDILNIASEGVYPESISNEVPDALLKKYFTRTDAGFSIKPRIRQSVVFAVHNLLVDAPFTRMDLVSCRNTLIYFSNEAQKEAVSRLQFALNEASYLMLGKSESLMINEEHFQSVDGCMKTYQCLRKISPRSLQIQTTKYGTPTLARESSDSKVGTVQMRDLEDQARRLLQRVYVPLSLIVNKDHEVVHIIGDKTDLLQLKPGNMSYQLSSLLPHELGAAALSVLHQVSKSEDPSLFGSVSAKASSALNNDTASQPSVIAYQLQCWELVNHYYLISIEPEQTSLPSSTDEHSGDTPLPLSEAQTARLEQLEAELHATRESLQATIEELETTNEELQATNEELMASNEELQSSNEELQSVNEELNTVNAEYHEKMLILNSINADLDAMSKSTGIATLFVDNYQHLTRFTPDVTEIFKVREQDIGRPLSEIVHYLEYDQLFNDIDLTITTGRPKEIEVIGKNSMVYLVRIVSYRLPSQDSYGAVISLIESKNFGSFQKVMDALPEHVAVLGEGGEILLVNQAWQRFAFRNAEDAQLGALGVGSNYLSVCGMDQDSGDIHDGIKEVLSGKTHQFSAKYPCHSPDEKRWYIMEVRRIEHAYYRAVITHFNVTRWED